jgi:hypothetical protein
VARHLPWELGCVGGNEGERFAADHPTQVLDRTFDGTKVLLQRRLRRLLVADSTKPRCLTTAVFRLLVDASQFEQPERVAVCPIHVDQGQQVGHQVVRSKRFCCAIGLAKANACLGSNPSLAIQLSSVQP